MTKDAAPKILAGAGGGGIAKPPVAAVRLAVHRVAF
jgi:hypothetical protein